MDELLHQILTALRGMWCRRWIGLAVAWVAAVVGAAVVLRIPDRYEASARVFVDTQTVLKPLMSGLAVQPNIDEQISMLARTLVARPNIEKLVSSSGLDSTISAHEKDRLIDEITQRIKFISVGRENLFTIGYQDADPERAKRVVQSFLSLFMESGVGNKRRDSEAARRFIDEQIKGYEKKLEEAESRVKDFKIKNVDFHTGVGQDFFSRMTALSEEVAKQRLELRVALESRDALRRELAGEDPIMMPDPGSSGAANAPSELDARIANQLKLLDDLLRRYTDGHPDVVATRRLIAQLEEQKKKEVESRRAAAAQNPSKFSSSTNPVFQQIKISLADAEANVAALRARLSESEERLARAKASASRAPQLEAEWAQLNRDYDILRKNYDQLASRRESASIAEDVDTQGQLAAFRVIDPPRISPKAVFPNRLALLPLVLVFALVAGAATAFAVSQVLPTFFDARQVRAATKRAVLGMVTLQVTPALVRYRRKRNLAFAGGLAGLFAVYGSWIAWVVLAGRA